ncbi:hypothetical protein TUM20985_13930 [Mycobacterium antarcticum]|nr:hypothetical protein TUM20985_13930 [Mycolicibacterium sp. TUM20985]
MGRRFVVRNIDGCKARNDGTNDLPSMGGAAPLGPEMTAANATPNGWERPFPTVNPIRPEPWVK